MAFWAMCRRDLALTLREGGGWANALVFFLLVGAFSGFAIGPDLERIRAFAAPILWIAALLACQLSLDRLFAADVEQGIVEIIALGPSSLTQFVAAKCVAVWVCAVAPLLAATPLLGVILNIAPQTLLGVVVTLLIGAPALVLWGALGSALSAGGKASGVLVALLATPLTAPTLIFGILGVRALESPGGWTAPELRYLLATTLIACVLAPPAAAAALKAQID